MLFRYWFNLLKNQIELFKISKINTFFKQFVQEKPRGEKNKRTYIESLSYTWFKNRYYL